MRDAMQRETGSWEHELLLSWPCETRRADQRAALVNEVLGDVELGPSVGQPDAATVCGIALLGRAALAVLFFWLAMRTAGLVDIAGRSAGRGRRCSPRWPLVGRADRRRDPRREPRVDAWVASLSSAPAAPRAREPLGVDRATPRKSADCSLLVDPYRRLDVYLSGTCALILPLSDVSKTRRRSHLLRSPSGDSR